MKLEDELKFFYISECSRVAATDTTVFMSRRYDNFNLCDNEQMTQTFNIGYHIVIKPTQQCARQSTNCHVSSA